MGKISTQFYFRHDKSANLKLVEKSNLYMYNKIQERANSRLGKSVSGLFRAKIRLCKFRRCIKYRCYVAWALH